MEKFHQDRVSTTIQLPATSYLPVDGRKYTITHDDETGQMFVTIGLNFAWENISSLRDEVLAEWVPHLGQYSLMGKVHVSGGQFDEDKAQVRYTIFNREMKKALMSMVIGDQSFFEKYPCFLDFPIYIQFESIFPQFNQLLYFGTPRTYVNQIICQSAI